MRAIILAILMVPEIIIAARTNPNVFVEWVSDVLQAPIHERIQRHLTDHDDSHSEFHRGMGKTTQYAGRCAWEIGRDRDIRIKYVQQNQKEAAKTVRLVKGIIESEEYRMVFPHILPDFECWGTHSLMVKRGRFRRDATIEASGVMGHASGRYDLLIGDDLCDLVNAIQKPAEREKVKESWNNNWLPMADKSARRKPRTWTTGTPYHVSDITADLRAYHSEAGTLLRVPVVDFVSPFDRVWTREELQIQRKKMGPIAYARAYELQPVSSDLLVFPAEWLEAAMYVQIPRDHQIGGEPIATFDFAFTDSRIGTKKKNGDPDSSACLIGVRSALGHVYLTDLIHGRMSFPEFKRRSIEACRRAGVKRGVGEATGAQVELVRQLNEEAPFPVIGVNRDKDKMTRATEQQSFVESGRLHIPMIDDPMGPRRPLPKFQVLFDEMTTFPAGGHDDTVDAAIDMMDMAGEQVAPIRTARKTRPEMPNLNRIYQ